SSDLRRFARAARAAGFACLRLNLRGADGAPDFYHAGLTADLDRVLSAPELASHGPRFLVGFSLGGHVALRWASERHEEAVAGVVAVCAPLDLDRGATALDASGTWLYRGYLLRGLKRFADGVERRAPQLVAAPRPERRRVRGIREWDGLVVAPRWGFASAQDYYARASVGPRLGRIRIPSWIVVAENDPMVPLWTVEEALRGSAPATEVTRTRRGGHVGFPADLDLGRRGPRGLAGQVLGWIAERA
ncbi:MAG TPA: alpha/beta fold hydrolase, partial [Thermoanaerobaculia bacterium]|nr:alpha/beta fold hydrolase [Thermoanaerobaculia bacterium]